MLSPSFTAYLLLSCLPLSVAHPLAAVTVAQVNDTADGEPLTQKLLGRWEIYRPGTASPPGIAQVLIFAPNGDLFYLEQPEGAVVRSSWSLDTSQSIIETNLGVPVTGKFSGPDLMEMSMEESVSADNPDDNDVPVIYMRRVSSDVSIPADRPIVEMADFFAAQVATARESEARTYVGAINRFQQATYLEQPSFEANIQAIARQVGGEGGKLLQSENYDYTVRLSADGNVVSTIAIPTHDGLRAFVGRVRVSADGSTVATFCQSTSPTAQMPDLPDGTGACPTDYVSVD
ncbi:MAG: type IV pilin-like G/H family protein [Leptolyngbyaceae cyanobacterium]